MKYSQLATSILFLNLVKNNLMISTEAARNLSKNDGNQKEKIDLVLLYKDCA